MKNKKFSFSKALTLICGLVFILCLYKAFTFDYTNVTDTAAIVCCITVSGGIAGGCIISYLKKAQAENLVKINTTLYKDTMDIRLDYNSKMMDLMSEHNMTQDDVTNIESQCNIDEISDGVLDTAVNEANETTADAHSAPTIQTYI